jgi:hypothetical protein
MRSASLWRSQISFLEAGRLSSEEVPSVRSQSNSPGSARPGREDRGKDPAWPEAPLDHQPPDYQPRLGRIAWLLLLLPGPDIASDSPGPASGHCYRPPPDLPREPGLCTLPPTCHRPKEPHEEPALDERPYKKPPLVARDPWPVAFEKDLDGQAAMPQRDCSFLEHWYLIGMPTVQHVGCTRVDGHVPSMGMYC